jgi:OOP family OmpA-OmpF porin
MSKKWLVSILGAVAMLLSAGALAQANMPAFYVGLDVGRADFGDENDTAFKILGGYQFHRNFAAEIGWSQLFDKDVGGINAEVTALEVVGVGMFPVAPQLSLLGKLGFANVEVEALGQSDDKTELTWGLGVQYDVSRNLGARVQWQRYETDEEVDLLTIGVIWRF